RRAKLLAGNSSAGLIEGAAIPIRCINLGRRQAGREKPSHLIDLETWDYQTLADAVKSALNQNPLANIHHPYGDGSAGPRTAEILANLPWDRCPLRKVNVY